MFIHPLTLNSTGPKQQTGMFIHPLTPNYTAPKAIDKKRPSPITFTSGRCIQTSIKMSTVNYMAMLMHLLRHILWGIWGSRQKKCSLLRWSQGAVDGHTAQLKPLRSMMAIQQADEAARRQDLQIFSGTSRPKPQFAEVLNTVVIPTP